MTKSNSNTQSIEFSKKFTRLMYASFVALAVYYLTVQHDLADAMSTLGIALIFDPFDQTIAWKLRPRYQHVWLIVHIAAVVALLVAMLFN